MDLLDGGRLPTASGRWLLTAVVALLAVDCAGGSTGSEATATATATTPPIVATAPPRGTSPARISGPDDLPPAARAGNGGPAPRPAAYWALWNSCAPENRATEAAANGGRAAGFILVDDLLVDPGIGLGDHALATCDEALAVITAGNGVSATLVERLAALLLVTELNLIVGSETCPAAEESAVGGQAVLAAAGYAGPGAPGDVPGGDAGQALPTFVALLESYVGGALCE